MLTKTQEQVSRQAKGPEEGPRPALNTGGQQVVQKVAIHLWHNANDPFWERSVVRRAIQVVLHWCLPAARRNTNSEISASKNTGSSTKKDSLGFLQ